MRDFGRSCTLRRSQRLADGLCKYVAGGGPGRLPPLCGLRCRAEYWWSIVGQRTRLTTASDVGQWGNFQDLKTLPSAAAVVER